MCQSTQRLLNWVHATVYWVKHYFVYKIYTVYNTALVTPIYLLTNQREYVRSGRHVLGDQHEEDGHGKEGGDAHGYLLPRIAGHVESEEGDESDEPARQDHVEYVEERFPAHLDRVGHIRVGLGTARVEDDVPDGVEFDQRPLAVRYVVGRVTVLADLDQVQLGWTHIKDTIIMHQRISNHVKLQKHWPHSTNELYCRTWFFQTITFLPMVRHTYYAFLQFNIKHAEIKDIMYRELHLTVDQYLKKNNLWLYLVRIVRFDRT